MQTENAEKYYKVILPSGKSPTQKFDYSPYLPRKTAHGTRAGRWLPKIDNARIERDGYYVSKYWHFWYEEGAKIYLVECRGMCPKGADQPAVEKERCCAQIRFLADVTDMLVPSVDAENTGKFNTGKANTGNRNSGVANTGDFNTGNRNTGRLNSGDFNTGDQNTGTDNVGDFNLGSCNVGSRNRGHSNTGNRNLGSYNTGSHNTGNSNAGSLNIGSHNVGKWNVGSFHLGYFNTAPQPFFMFNKPVENAEFRDIKLPTWLYAPNPKEAFEKLPPEEAEKALSLPNFDFSVFEKITQISKSDFERKLGKRL